jgi:isopentenyl diphosphate isomerase/L-lactate dehydrogenase-like FMN-dependent dehydrogenase
MSGAEMSSTRRKFLQFLAASPAIASLGGVAAFMGDVVAHSQEPAAGGPSASQVVDPQIHYPLPWEFADFGRTYSDVIKDPKQALDVFDFEEPMHRAMLPGHWAHYVSGAFSEATLHANRAGFQHVFLKPRRLMPDIMSKLSTKFSLFGDTYDAPIFTCPTGGQRSIWLEDGELSVSRACKTKNTMQMLAFGCSESPEDCSAALGRPVVMQIYAPAVYSNTQIALKRLEAAGVKTINLTVDVATGRYMETENHILQTVDPSTCSGCHTAMNGHPEGMAGSAGIMEKGFDNSKDLPRSPLDWNYVDRMRQDWKGKFGIKGILTPEDAALCIKHGIDFIHVSNHGGREPEMGSSTIQALPAIVAEVKGRVPVFLDSGVRRGTDVFKALALGATAVGVGHPVLWGLGAFGEPGVAKVLELLQYELKMTMGNVGAATLADINKNFVECDWSSPLPVTA